MDKKRIGLVSLGHLSCDINSGALPAVLPFLVAQYGFSYQAAAGLMFANSCLSSLVQPFFGLLADKRATAWFIPLGVVLAGIGVSGTGFLSNYWALFVSISVMSLGAALFHPEGARFANKVSGKAKGTGLSIFSVGGNSGFVFGPMLAVAAIGLFGLPGMGVFAVLGVLMGAVLYGPTARLDAHIGHGPVAVAANAAPEENNWTEFCKLLVAIVARSVMFVGLNTFIPLYWIHSYGVSNSMAAMVLTLFCAFGVLSNVVGGVLSDRFGFVRIVRYSYLFLVPTITALSFVENEVLAFLLLLPLGFTLFAPFSAMVVLGQKYLAKNIGFASGVTLGLGTSMGGVVAPLLGWIADTYGLQAAFLAMSVVAVMGCVAAFCMSLSEKKKVSAP